MTLDQIKALPVASCAADDCALFMWCVNPMLPHALEVIDAWGFKFKTVAFTWAKRSTTGRAWHTGLGYWTRPNTEQKGRAPCRERGCQKEWRSVAAVVLKKQKKR